MQSQYDNKDIKYCPPPPWRFWPKGHLDVQRIPKKVLFDLDFLKMSLYDFELEPPFSDVVTDDELASLNIKDLNRKLKEKGLNKDLIEKLKQRRRTLKNRKYATE